MSESKITKTIKHVMPAVVSVVVSQKLERVKEQLKREKNSAKVPEEEVDENGLVQVGGGSGFIVDPEGIVLTNRHVINEPFSQYYIITNDEKKFHAEVLARDPIDDIAILKIHPGKTKLRAVKLGNAKKINLGETVLAFGNPLGLFESTVSRGIVSGLARSISAKESDSAPIQQLRGLIQTDAAINPGNSGGPLTNEKGEVIGINAAVIEAAQNIGFAIPINAAERDLDDIKKFGKIKRPLLGIRYLTLTAGLKRKLKLTSAQGALITKENPMDIAVAPQGPAAKAGMREGDIITRWNGKTITPKKTIQDYLEDAEVGDAIHLSILRGKRHLEKIVSLTERK